MNTQSTMSDNHKGSVIYFDNAATSWPKPPEVGKAMLDYLQNVGANPGRSGHTKAVESGQILFAARVSLARLFGLNNPMHVIFTSNATEALNLAIMGVLSKGDHVITSSMEHNSTIRPLHYLEKSGQISLTILAGDKRGKISPSQLKDAITDQTRAVVINHVSNVNGNTQDLQQLGKICQQHNRGYAECQN